MNAETTRLPFIAHAPTMRVPGSIRGTEQVYAATWAAALAIHRHSEHPKKIQSVAFPAMGTGFSGDFPSTKLPGKWLPRIVCICNRRTALIGIGSLTDRR